MGKKALIAYFSCSGATKRVAQTLAAVAGADLYEIRPVVPYTAADLNWRDKNSRSTIEMKDPSSRPAIAGKVPNMSEYNIIFVGFPIWWYAAPTIINTFLESYDFSGKTIILFATSGGSGFGKTVERLKPSVSATTTLKEGKVFHGKIDAAELAAWFKSINL